MLEACRGHEPCEANCIWKITGYGGNMKQLRVFVSVTFIAISGSAGADSLSSIKTCITQGYNGMTNRHGIAAAVVDAYGWQIMTFGSAKPDQLFEIGSVTKTFTANLLAQSVASGAININDAIPDAYQKQGSTITYQHLTTHLESRDFFPDFSSLFKQPFPV